MAGSLGDLGGLLHQAQKMQRTMAQLQEEFGKRTFEGRAGGGRVRVLLSGSRQVREVKIDPEVVDREDVELLEDLVGSAFGDALKQLEETLQAEMKRVTGGVGLPGMF